MKIEELAECFPLWSYLHEEMTERGWDIKETAIHMGGTTREVAINMLALEFLRDVRDPDMYLGDDMAKGLSIAFDVPATFFKNIDEAYRVWLRAKRKRDSAAELNTI